MKVRLMYADRDFAPDARLPVNEPDLAADLELGTLLDAMAGGDKFLFGVARHGLHSGLADPAEITAWFAAKVADYRLKGLIAQ